MIILSIIAFCAYLMILEYGGEAAAGGAAVAAESGKTAAEAGAAAGAAEGAGAATATGAGITSGATLEAGGMAGASAGASAGAGAAGGAAAGGATVGGITASQAIMGGAALVTGLGTQLFSPDIKMPTAPTLGDGVTPDAIANPEDLAAQKKAEDAAKAQQEALELQRRGRASTIATGPQGVTGPAPTSKKSLLGE